jgi:hypothetical protein
LRQGSGKDNGSLNVFLLQQRKECEDCFDGTAGRKAGQNRSPSDPRAAEYRLSTAYRGVRNDSFFQWDRMTAVPFMVAPALIIHEITEIAQIRLLSFLA